MEAPSLSSSFEENRRPEVSDATATGSTLSSAQELPGAQRLSRPERMLMGGLAVALAGMLAVGAWLSPSPSGMGTHQQLGLPPCTMVYLMGIRCPGCGMTTSWALMLEGRVFDSFQTNSGGALLCLMAIWATPIAGWFALQGRGSKTGWFSWYAAAGLLIALGVSTIDWIIRLIH